MKTMEQTISNPQAATPMELALANFDMLAAAARAAVAKNEPAKLRAVMDQMERNAAMVKRWLAEVAS